MTNHASVANSDQMVTKLVEAYKSVQAMCNSLGLKLKVLVDELVKQELALLDSIEPTMQLDSEEQGAVWKAKLGGIYKQALVKSIADELSF